MKLDGFTEVTPILRSGIYVLIAKGTVVYVGKSKAIMGRLNSHRTGWIDKRKGRKPWVQEVCGIPALWFDEIHVKYVPAHLLDAAERDAIDRYKPRYNIKLQTKTITTAFDLTIGSHSIRINSPPPAPKLRIERRI